MRFTSAIVRRPCPSMVNGLTTAGLGLPDFELAQRQHDAYIEALLGCGLEVDVLEPDNDHPDSVFVEDPALLTPRCAVITHPGASSRRGETAAIRDAVAGYYDVIEQIEPPGTVDAGDVMMVGSHYYIGLSARTSEIGAQQLKEILEKHGLTGSTVDVSRSLHLKSNAAYLEDGNLVLSGGMIGRAEFEQFNVIALDTREIYAANCVWINGTVLLAAGYPKARAAIEGAGYPIVELDMSEFRKLDGGLSCLSLRF